MIQLRQAWAAFWSKYHFAGRYLVVGKDFVFTYQSMVMWLKETTDYLIGNANEVCFTAALFISFLFFKQYKKYEAELENEEMIENFLHS